MKYFFIILGVIILIAGGYFVLGRSPKIKYDFVVVRKQDVVQQVSVTGKLEALQNVNLAFEKSGKISIINIEVGDKVSAGEILLSLENEDLRAQLLEAEADLKAQQAKLLELRQGSRPEKIQVQEAKIESGKVSLESAKKDLINKIKDSYTKSEDAVRNKTDQFFDNPRSQSPQLNIQISDSSLKQNISGRRFLVEGVLTSWNLSLIGLIISSDLDLYTTEAKENLEEIRFFLEQLALAVNSLIPTQSLSLTTINTYKSDVSTARTNVNMAITNLLATEESLKNSESALSLSEKELELEKAGSSQEQILAQGAQVEAAQASVKNYQAQISKTIITSPINGIIARQDAKIGEIISANTSLISIISAGTFEIKANVPEADIAKVKIGDTTDITLDAYGPDILFFAKVDKIDPAETVIEGVPTYKVTLYFNKEDERLRSGMTANIDILTAQSRDAITVPQRAVISKNGNKTVKILDGKEIRDVEVKIGLRGTDGNVEIIEGIKEGDKVITFIKEK